MKNSELEEYLQEAVKLDFNKVIFLDDLKLKANPELRAHCNKLQCFNYGENWVCPPGCGSLEFCQGKLDNFDRGILVQSITELSILTSREKYQELSFEHNSRFKKLIELVQETHYEVLPLTTGSCFFCHKCSYPMACLKPDVKMESLSAFGVDVTKLCHDAELSFEFRDDIVYYTALLLIK